MQFGEFLCTCFRLLDQWRVTFISSKSGNRDRDGTRREKRNKTASRSTSKIFRDRHHKKGTVPEKTGRMVALSWKGWAASIYGLRFKHKSFVSFFRTGETLLLLGRGWHSTQKPWSTTVSHSITSSRAHRRRKHLSRSSISSSWNVVHTYCCSGTMRRFFR